MLNSENDQFIGDFMQIVERDIAAAAEIDDPFSEAIFDGPPHFGHVLQCGDGISDGGDGAQCCGGIFLGEKLMQAKQILAGPL